MRKLIQRLAIGAVATSWLSQLPYLRWLIYPANVLIILAFFATIDYWHNGDLDD